MRDWQRRVTAEGRAEEHEQRRLHAAALCRARRLPRRARSELLDGKADIDLPDPDGVTPLVLALMNVHFDLARYLIEAGADVNQWDFYGQTPLYVAVDMNTLPRGGRPDLPSTDHLTGYDVARAAAEGGRESEHRSSSCVRRIATTSSIAAATRCISTGATPLLRAAKAGDAKPWRCC